MFAINILYCVCESGEIGFIHVCFILNLTDLTTSSIFHCSTDFLISE